MIADRDAEEPEPLATEQNLATVVPVDAQRPVAQRRLEVAGERVIGLVVVAVRIDHRHVRHEHSLFVIPTDLLHTSHRAAPFMSRSQRRCPGTRAPSSATWRRTGPRGRSPARASARLGVPPLGPDRVRPGQPHSPDDGHERHDDADHTGAELPLHEADDDEAQVDRHATEDDVAEARLTMLAGRGPQQDEHDHAADEEDGVHRRAALLAPVDVVEVEDQGELVEHQRQPDTEGHAGQRSPPDGLSTEGGETAYDHEHEARDRVVDVHAADHVVLE